MSEYYTEVGVKCAYLHSEIAALDRMKILRDLRRGELDVLVGVNLLREGLDLPEVSLVAILDADKEGFLRSAGSLIQTMGRAARHLNGTRGSLRRRLSPTACAAPSTKPTAAAPSRSSTTRTNNITPQSIIKPIDMSLVAIAEGDYVTVPIEPEDPAEEMTPEQREKFIAELEESMRDAAKKIRV